MNINEHCGSTHLESLAEGVVKGGYDLGIAFDGDADRCLLIDEKGGYSDLAVTQNDVVCIYETGWQAELETCIFPRQLAVARIEKCLLR